MLTEALPEGEEGHRASYSKDVLEVGGAGMWESERQARATNELGNAHSVGDRHCEERISIRSSRSRCGQDSLVSSEQGGVRIERRRRRIAFRPGSRLGRGSEICILPSDVSALSQARAESTSRNEGFGQGPAWSAGRGLDRARFHSAI